MLNNKKIMIMADSVVNSTKIASHSATLTIGAGEMTLTSRYLDKAACEANEDAVKADQQEFEDYVYSIYTTDTITVASST
jgi:16S rRNA A1518/A1519 N6-dimethyltransferase RsmA/KsgA/DIM1 with predicted DNA glycosylase/AP lyase activity